MVLTLFGKTKTENCGLELIASSQLNFKTQKSVLLVILFDIGILLTQTSSSSPWGSVG